MLDGTAIAAVLDINSKTVSRTAHFKRQ